MKIMHVADLHFGKKIHGIDLIESGDQPDWLEKFLDLVRTEKPQVILIAGDVYDRNTLNREAVNLVGRMLSELSAMEWEPYILMTAGNHDAGAMVEYLGDVVSRQHIIAVGTTEREIRHVALSDEFGEVVFWLVPYVFPAEINRVLGTEYRNYDAAFRAYLDAQDIDFTKRNVIISHQNVTAFGVEAERGGSETMVGGVGGIEYTAYDGFEYAALGHIHAAQPMGRNAVRYAGSPLCYHFDELRHPKKGPVLVELGEKGTEPQIKIHELLPLHPMREVAGSISEIEAAESRSTHRGEYIRVILKPEIDENGLTVELGNESKRLDALFAVQGSRVLDTSYERRSGYSDSETWSGERHGELPIEEQFAGFWAERTGTEPDAGSMGLLRFIAEQNRNSKTDGDDPTTAEVNEILDFALKQED